MGAFLAALLTAVLVFFSCCFTCAADESWSVVIPLDTGFVQTCSWPTWSTCSQYGYYFCNNYPLPLSLDFTDQTPEGALWTGVEVEMMGSLACENSGTVKFLLNNQQFASWEMHTAQYSCNCRIEQDSHAEAATWSEDETETYINLFSYKTGGHNSIQIHPGPQMEFCQCAVGVTGYYVFPSNSTGEQPQECYNILTDHPELGLGFNAFTGENAQFSVVSQWTFDDGKVLDTYDASGEVYTYCVPDSVASQYSPRYGVESFTFDSVSALQDQVGHDIGLTGGYSVDSIPILSASLAMQAVNDEMSSSKQSYLLVREFADAFSFLLDLDQSLYLNPDFISDVDGLPTSCCSGNETAIFEQFLGRYGTHLIIESTFGGSAQFTSWGELYNDRVSTSLNMQMQASVLFFDATTPVESISIRPMDKSPTTVPMYTTDWTLTGGNVHVNMSSNSWYDDWIASVPSDPAEVGKRVVPLLGVISRLSAGRASAYGEFVLQFGNDCLSSGDCTNFGASATPRDVVLTYDSQYGKLNCNACQLPACDDCDEHTVLCTPHYPLIQVGVTTHSDVPDNVVEGCCDDEDTLPTSFGATPRLNWSLYLFQEFDSPALKTKAPEPESVSVLGRKLWSRRRDEAREDAHTVEQHINSLNAIHDESESTVGDSEMRVEESTARRMPFRSSPHERLSASVTGNTENSLLPGIDVFGVGVDASDGTLRLPLLAWNYTQGKTWTNPVIQTTFIYPDQVRIDSSGSKRLSTRLFTSAQQLADSVSSERGLNIGFDVGEASFTVGREVTETERTFEGAQSILATTGEIYSAYTLSLDTTTPALTENFLAALDGLPRSYNESTSPAFEEFLSFYGTHVVVDATYGGKALLMSSVDQNYFMSESQTSIQNGVEAHYKGFVAGAAYGVTDDTDVENFASESFAWMWLYGGSAPTMTTNHWDTWNETTLGAPTQVDQQTVPITEFISDAALAANVRLAAASYLKSRARALPTEAVDLDMTLSARAVSQTQLRPQLGSQNALNFLHDLLWINNDYLLLLSGAQSSQLQLTPTSSGTYYTPPPFTLLTSYGPKSYSLSGSHDENAVCPHPYFISLSYELVDFDLYGDYEVLSDPACFLMGYRP